MSFSPKNHYSKDELVACSNGELFTKEGDGRLPSDQMLMFDEINNIDDHSGLYNKGSIEATLNINGFLISLTVMFLFLFLGIRTFRKLEKTFADMM